MAQASSHFRSTGLVVWPSGQVRVGQVGAPWGPAVLPLPAGDVSLKAKVSVSLTLQVPVDACSGIGPGEPCLFQLAYHLDRLKNGTWEPFGD